MKSRTPLFIARTNLGSILILSLNLSPGVPSNLFNQVFLLKCGHVYPFNVCDTLCTSYPFPVQHLHNKSYLVYFGHWTLGALTCPNRELASEAMKARVYGQGIEFRKVNLTGQQRHTESANNTYMTRVGFKHMIPAFERKKVQIMKFPHYLIFLYNRVFQIPPNPKGAPLFSIIFKKKVKLLHSLNMEE